MLEGVSRAFTQVVRKVTGKAAISEKNIADAIEDIKKALLEADVNLRVVRRFINRTAEDARGEKVLRAVNPSQQFVKIVYDRLVALLGSELQPLELKGKDTISKVLMLGLQGAGKTTTAAKLAQRLKNDGRRVLLVAGDLQRPAAIEQLSQLGRQIGVTVHSRLNATEQRPLVVVKEALARAKKELFDTLIVDTAGRLQINDELMVQLEEVKKVLKPEETLLVADSMTGQNAVDIAKTFHERLQLTGVILSKFDSDTRGGAALSIKSITQQPIKYIGTGEQINDLELFHPERIASRILGMGDVVSLVEQAQQVTDHESSEKLQKKILKENFTLEDMLLQFQQMRKIGSMDKIAEMLPGLSELGSVSEMGQELKRKEAIILSMTRQERNHSRIIGPSRRRRVARGSGTSVADVNRLLKEFEKSRQVMKKMLKNKSYQAKMLGGLMGGQPGAFER